MSLPIHPRLCHPLTGEPLRAVFVDKRGRPRWPVMGAQDDPPSDDPPKDDPPKPDPKPESDKDLGFPKDTPVAEMTSEQQVAYWTHKARKHEDRNKGWRDALGEKSPEDVKKQLDELEELRRERLTESERALEDAKKTARDETVTEFAPKAVKMAFEFALDHVEEAERNDLIDTLNLSKFIDSNGDVDTARVKEVAKKIAPADTDTGGKRVDYGAGKRTPTSSAGVSAGEELFANRRKPAASPST